jgi:hypothetical protein
MLGASFSFAAERDRVSPGEVIDVALRETRQPPPLLWLLTPHDINLAFRLEK